MTDLEIKIQTEIKRLLDENIVDVVIAFREADTPLRPQPAFFRNSDDIKDLKYNGLCQNNLANYLTRYPSDTRIGIVVRGCENRSVNALIVEKQHERDKLFLIGVPCTGILDWHKIVGRVGEDFQNVVEEQDTVQVTLRQSSVSIERKELLHDSCLRCVHPNPLSADLLLGEPLPEADPDIIRKPVEEFEQFSRKERYAWFSKEAERCIRCYACREACPMCYCTECFVDHNSPRWVESGVSPAGMQAWHLIRAFHQTGRCTSCGACERACPMDIKMTYLTDKLNKDMYDCYQFVTGMDDKTQPPFAAFSLDDKTRFAA